MFSKCFICSYLNRLAVVEPSTAWADVDESQEKTVRTEEKPPPYKVRIQFSHKHLIKIKTNLRKIKDNDKF